MALDVGERTVGIALTDPEQRIASPHSTLRRTSIDEDIRSLCRLIQDHQVDRVIVGLPRSLSGDLAYQAEQTLRFVEQLRGAIAAPIVTWDERFSTAEALRSMESGGLRKQKRQERVDQIAAAIILQGYLAAEQYRRFE